MSIGILKLFKPLSEGPIYSGKSALGTDLYFLSPVSLVRDNILCLEKNNFPYNIGIFILKHFLYLSLSCLTCKFEVAHAALI